MNYPEQHVYIHDSKLEFLGNKIFEGLFVLGVFTFFGLIAHALLT